MLTWIHLEDVDSTNDALRTRATQGAAHGTVVVADRQRAGRGRMGRTWASVEGNLHLSVLVRTALPASSGGLLALGAAVAIAEAAGPAYRIKWPNDVLDAEGKKVAGVLCERDGDAVVVGIGVNLVHPGIPGAGWLGADGEGRDRLGWGRSVAEGVLAVAEALAVDPGGVLDRWRARADTLGRVVRAGDRVGRAVDVDGDGALLLDTGGGRVRIVAGDVITTTQITG